MRRRGNSLKINQKGGTTKMRMEEKKKEPQAVYNNQEF